MAKSCSVEGCERPARSRGLCNAHYQRWLNHGDPLKMLPPRGGPQPTPWEPRFWAKVDKDGPVPDYAPHLGPCWLWTAGTANAGYGSFQNRGAHRIAYELLIGPIPPRLDLDHLCRVPACVNPDHLEPVTHRENILRGLGPIPANAAKTHCSRGHEYTDENTRLDPVGRRRCRECERQWARESAHRRRVAKAPSEHPGGMALPGFQGDAPSAR